MQARLHEVADRHGRKNRYRELIIADSEALFERFRYYCIEHHAISFISVELGEWSEDVLVTLLPSVSTATSSARYARLVLVTRGSRDRFEAVLEFIKAHSPDLVEEGRVFTAVVPTGPEERASLCRAIGEATSVAPDRPISDG